MYASLHVRDCSLTQLLLEVARRFSPEVECSNDGQNVTFSIAPLRKMIGSPHQIASEICHAGYEHKVQASLAIAANPDAAIVLSRHFMGVTMVTPGEERLKLGAIPLSELFAYAPSKLSPSMLEILLRWGIKTCEDLVALPELGIRERLGTAGVYLRNLAGGFVQRPLRLQNKPIRYEVRMELDHSLTLLEPLLFLLSRSISEQCQLLRSQSQAARELHLQLELDAGVIDEEKAAEGNDQQAKTYGCRLEFPIPLDEPLAILKLLQLHLERHAPGAPVKALYLHLEPTDPKRVQRGIFLPSTPAPDKLHVTLARIADMVGKNNVGTPELLDTHRPDAFKNHFMPGQNLPKSFPFSQEEARPEMLRLAIRLFRPALQARVQVARLTPKLVQASGVRGHVTRYAGPWKTAGEWWTDTAWSREEWDVALDDGALYRIYQESASRQWFVHGVYD